MEQQTRNKVLSGERMTSLLSHWRLGVEEGSLSVTLRHADPDGLSSVNEDVGISLNHVKGLWTSP